MSPQVPEKNLFVEDVVTALTGPVDARGNSTTALQDQMRRATEEFDQRTAEAFARSLLESLCQDEIDVRRLEALLILGLAHPTILERHRISLRTEGQRLAKMLEHQGQADRARVLLGVIEQTIGPNDGFVVEAEETPPPSKKTGKARSASAGPQASTEDLIEEYVQKAERAAECGRAPEAIRWLQEVISLDRNRRDVMRMIRDLRWSENERHLRNRRRFKIAALVVLVVGLAFGVRWREMHIEAEYLAIPPAGEQLFALTERLDAIDALVAANYAWLNMAPVLREQNHLRRQISVAESKAAEVAHQVAVERAQRMQEAQSVLSRGMLLAQQGRFEEALVDLRRSLELAEPTWSERNQVQANVVAIEAWLKKAP